MQDDVAQRELVVSYSKLLNAFFMEPKCRLMTNDEYKKVYMYTQVTTAALVKYNVISSSDMDKVVKRGVDSSANDCDRQAMSDIAFAKENAEDVARQIKLSLGKDDQWSDEEELYTLLNAIARVSYKSLMGAWYIEDQCKFLTTAQSNIWQEQTALVTKQFLDQKYLKEDEIKAVQRDAHALAKGYPCDEKSKSIVSDALKASAVTVEPPK